jgi:hypothetical protein
VEFVTIYVPKRGDVRDPSSFGDDLDGLHTPECVRPEAANTGLILICG